MDIAKSYIVDKDGKPEAVVIDYSTFKKVENLLLDAGLGKAMEEVADDEELDIEEAKRLARHISKEK
ncbi:MAG: antitoxin [Bacteroidetes bacterium]|nr:antitoxin [Bacteroidota bacterium]